jgi:(p)ppGpp synthase/HD superfamily hydrolase
VENKVNRFSSALSFAAQLHRNQFRKATGIPYISHLIAVAALVMEDGGSEDEAIAALLHDAIEDQGDTYTGGRVRLREVIRLEFGQEVLDIINGCTDDEGHQKEGLSGTDEAAAWRMRKEAYIGHLREERNPSVLRVSCADKLHNSRTILADYRNLGECIWNRFRTKSGDDQVWCYRELAKAFAERGGRLSEQLTATVSELEALCEERKQYELGGPVSDLDGGDGIIANH